ncbi:MAG: phage tail tube protein [Actinomycetota bacterium]|nr:phage tail tube protein [Actinomycetota bacterium]
MSVTGVELKAAVKRATTWGAAAACGANSGVLIKPHTIKKKRNTITDDSMGLYFPQNAVNAEIDVSGALPAYLRYDSLDLLIALAMGSVPGAPVQQGATPAYAQSFIMAASLGGLFATYIQNNTVNIDEYTSIKVSGFTIKGDVGKPVEISFDVMAYDRVTNSAVNTTGTFAGVTYMETGNRVLFSQGVYRMNNQGDAALASASVIYPSGFELSFKRKMKGLYTVAGFVNIDEPSSDGFPEVKLKLTFPRYTANIQQIFADWDATQQKKMDMTFTGAQIASPYNRSFQIQLPCLQITSADLPLKHGIMEAPMEFVALGCAAAPAGMNGVIQPFQINVINQQGANVLTS